MVLRPRRPRLFFFIAAGLALTAGGVAALASAPGAAAVVLGLVLLAGGLWLTALAGGRLLVPLGYATVLDRAGFTVHDSFGRVTARVGWDELAELQPVPVASTAFPGLREPIVGWRCRPRRPLRRGLAGRLLRISRMVDVDGVLPDPYRGLDHTMETLSDAAVASGLCPQLTTRGWSRLVRLRD